MPRDDIRAALWPAETFVDYDQGMNFAMKQVREALGDDADHPVYVQTVPEARLSVHRAGRRRASATRPQPHPTRISRKRT